MGLKCTKTRFWLGLFPRPRWGAYEGPHTPYLDCRESASSKGGKGGKGGKGLWWCPISQLSKVILHPYELIFTIRIFMCFVRLTVNFQNAKSCFRCDLLCYVSPCCYCEPVLRLSGHLATNAHTTLCYQAEPTYRPFFKTIKINYSNLNEPKQNIFTGNVQHKCLNNVDYELYR